MPKPWKQRFEKEPGSGEPATEPEIAVDWREAAFMAAELGETPELDLHGQSVSNALRDLDQFLHHELAAGTEAVHVIYGAGEGVLKKAVLGWLEAQKSEQDFIALYRPSLRTASVIIVLERFRPSM